MGRLNEKQKARARAGEHSVAARGARRALLLRGVSIARRLLGRQTLAECIDAIGWARNRRPVSARPAWIGALLDTGRAHLVGGVCAVCGCTDRRACAPFGCSWTTRARTLCSACDPRETLTLERLVGPPPDA
jgi:hypothetical protein